MKLRAALVLAAVAIVASCGPRRAPLLQPLAALERRTPVVILPGITGSMLRDRESGEVVWGNARAFFRPHDGGYALARPIPAGTVDRLEAFAPIFDVRLFGIWRVDVYAALARLMQANGYRLGDLERPLGGGDAFFFPYDWRQGSVAAVRDLARKLEGLRRARGNATLHVNLVCQSNAGRIARWFVKYGSGSLEEAEAGVARPPPTIAVDRIVLIGTANGGGLRTLGDLQNGRKYVRWIGRKLQPEAIATLVSVYEELPFYGEDWFVGRDGPAPRATLADPADWKRYGWGLYRPQSLERIERSGRTDLFGDERQRAAFLAGALDRAQRLHRLLRADAPGFSDTRYYSIQSDAFPTPERARLERHGHGWRTRVGPGRGRPPARAPGDGHATLASQAWLSPQETAAFAHETVYVRAEHRKIVLSREAHRLLLEFLLEEAGPALSASKGR